MEILLLILKIIGIALLSLLCLALLLILVVLFVPVRYRLYAGYYDKEPDISAKVYWLLHILHISLRITKQDKSCIVRIFGIPLLDVFHKKPVKEKKRKSKKKQTKKIEIKKEEHKDKERENVTLHLTDQDRPDKNDNNDSEPDKKNFLEKLSEFIKKVTDFLLSIPDKIAAIPEKIEEAEKKGIHARTQAEKWVEVLKRDRTKKAVECAKELLIWLLKKLLPKKWTASVRFGFKDPAATAQILGYYWMFIGILTDHLSCQPEFEKEIMEGNVRMNGHIRGITFVIAGWKILFDPNLKYLRKIKAEVDAL